MDLKPQLELASGREEFGRLVRALRLARGFRLYFARSMPGESRKLLLDQLSSTLDGKIRIFAIQSDLDHLREELEQTLVSGPLPMAVCVTGIETWVPAGDEGAGAVFVRNLNASRDRFAHAVPCPLVIWGADHVLRAIQRGAPDFFSVASGIYLFPDNTSVSSQTFEQDASLLEGMTLWLRELEEVKQHLDALGPEPTGLAMVDRFGVLNREVQLLRAIGRIDEAQALGVKVYGEARDIFGADDLGALTSANNLAEVYKTAGNYAEAEPLYVATLEGRRKALGPDHPDTLASANNLAVLYKTTGRFAEAEPLYAATLEAQRRILGPDHPDSLSIANNLAVLYGSTGRYPEAEPLLVTTLETRRRILGPAHPDTLVSLNNLAGLYQSMGRYAEAEPLCVTTLETLRRVLGPDHPDTLASANNLAHLYRETGRSGEALSLLEALLPLVQRLPPSHKVREGIESSVKVLGESG